MQLNGPNSNIENSSSIWKQETNRSTVDSARLWLKSLMISIVAIFELPLWNHKEIENGISLQGQHPRNQLLMVEVICQTVEYCSTWQRRSTCSLPTSEIRFMSLRKRSTIIIFSGAILGILLQPTGLFKIFLVSYPHAESFPSLVVLSTRGHFAQKEFWTHGNHCHLVMFNISIVARLLLYYHTIVDGKRIGT